jgi:hypothetical protein
VPQADLALHYITIGCWLWPVATIHGHDLLALVASCTRVLLLRALGVGWLHKHAARLHVCMCMCMSMSRRMPMQSCLSACDMGCAVRCTRLSDTPCGTHAHSVELITHEG